jgi:hypothetical protein
MEVRVLSTAPNFRKKSDIEQFSAPEKFSGDFVFAG